MINFQALMVGISILVASFFGKPTVSFALDAASEEALGQTTNLLTNSAERKKVIDQDRKAKAADDHVKSVAGENSEDVYGLASKVFEKLAKKYNGDVNKMNEVIEAAKKNPEGFVNSEFTPEEIRALREIASKIGPATGPTK
jgi:hypothetical protein